MNKLYFLLNVVVLLPALALAAGNSAATPNPKPCSDAVRSDIASATTGKGAALVGFKRADTGAVARTVLDKLRDSVNVKDFGAVSDGTTDDAAAVQAAINSVADYAGSVVVIPPNTAVGSTIDIVNKKGIILSGVNGQGFPYVGASFIPTLKWIGAPGGMVVHITNPLEITIKDMAISGENIAAYGLRISGTNSGWGVSNYENLSIHGNTKNAMLKDATAGAGDFGRNHFKRVTFACSHVATGENKNDACVVYNNDSSVQDVYEHCEFLYLSSGGLHIAGTYAIWIEAGTPRIYINNSYTKAQFGIYSKATGATPKFVISDHYSEDVNFISFPNANTPQVVRNAVHARAGGVSILWGGASGGGMPLIIDGGYYAGSISLTNSSAGVVLSNSPVFLGGYPIFTDGQHKIIIGRANGKASTETHGAINGSAFVPAQAAQQTSITINANLTMGSIFPVLLSGNSSVSAPTSIDANALDVGREIEFRITGNATNNFTVSFNAAYKLASGSYAHSGATRTDVIRFRCDGTHWWEIGRSMNIF